MASGKLLEIALREFGVTESQNISVNNYHYVNQNDTLYSLARTFNTTVDLLKKWNNLTGTTIITGQPLRVSEPKSAEIAESRVLQYIKETGIQGVTSEQDAWCSVWLNWVCMKAGLPMSKNAAARSWLNVGTPVTDLNGADVVIYWRGSKDSIFGHVGIPASYTSDKQHVYTLGGNQGNAVSIKPYEATRVLGFRKLI